MNNDFGIIEVFQKFIRSQGLRQYTYVKLQNHCNICHDLTELISM